MRSLLRCVLLGLVAGSVACSSSGDTAQPAGGSTGQGGASTGSGSTTDGGVPSGLGPATFAPGELDAASNGATITFQDIGAPGWHAARGWEQRGGPLLHGHVVPEAIAPVLPDLPGAADQGAIAGLLSFRLPR